MGGGSPKEHLLITLSGDEPKDITDRLRKNFPDVTITYHDVTAKEQDKKDLPKDIFKSATSLVTLFTFPAAVADAPALDYIQLISAGSNQIQKNPLYTSSDAAICTATGIHGPQIAEWVLMTQLVFSHQYDRLHEAQKRREWSKGDYFAVRDMVGQRLGVLGYGSIGRQVGRVAKAMGMDVIAYTATPKDTADKKKDVGFIVPGTGDADGSIPSEWYSGLDKESLHHFLEQDIDFLLVAVPLTDDTRHFLSTEEFKVLSKRGKRPAFITNIARGAIIDQPALIESLKDGTLQGAALDVTDPEPLPSDNELWGLDNVIVTPHISGGGVTYTERAFQLVEENLRRKLKGDKLLNVVDRKKGY